MSIEVIKSPLVIRKKLNQYLDSWIWSGKGNSGLIYRKYSPSNRACDIEINACRGFVNGVWVDAEEFHTGDMLPSVWVVEPFQDIDYETVGEILRSRLIEKEYECGCGRTHPANFNSSNVIYHAFGARRWSPERTEWSERIKRMVQVTNREVFKRGRKTVNSFLQIFIVRCPKPNPNDEDFVTFIKITPQRVPPLNRGMRPSKVGSKILLRLESLWSCSYEDLCEWDASLNSREKGTRLLGLRISVFWFLYLVFISLVYFYLILPVLDLPIYFDIALAIFYFSVVVPPTLSSSSYHRSPTPHPKVYSKILTEKLISRSHGLNKLVRFAFVIVIFIGIYIGYSESFGFSETYNRFLEIYNKFLGKDFVIVSIILTSIVIYIKLVKYALTNINKHQNLSSFMSAYYQGYGKWKKSLLKIIKDSFWGAYMGSDAKKYLDAIKNRDWEYVRSTTVVYFAAWLFCILIAFIILRYI